MINGGAADAPAPTPAPARRGPAVASMEPGPAALGYSAQ
jgi:hypothetical protein